MKVNLHTIKSLINFELPPIDELVVRINSQLGGVEEVIDLNAKYKDAKIVRVVECEKHPNADKLSICKIDVGNKDLVQVVCGAPNVHADMWVVWLPPESTVPSTFGDAEPFVLGARELRGVMSNGMLASAKELGIGDDHNGIIEIAEHDLLQGQSLQAGASFAKTFGLDDYVVDIENKMFTHRPDLFGQLGVAREIAGILGKQFESPEWYKKVPTFAAASSLELEVFNDIAEKAPRFMAVALKDVEVKPSPLWLQCTLVAMGGKPINNIVDATNYVMLMTAQPTHAYDYDKIRGHKLGVRMAKNGEAVPLLNGKTYELDESDIVIADGEGVIGLAGIMGGGNSEVSNDTKNIVLEVANFDMYTVRKSSMRHGLFTDALTRFNKGQSPLQNDRVLAMLMEQIFETAGGMQASIVFDESSDELQHRLESQDGGMPQAIEPSFIRDRLGIAMKKYDMVQLLGNVEFPLCEDCGWNPEDEKDNNEPLHVNVPFWRTDIDLPEDVVEEIGRLYGFDKLPRELPKRSAKPAPKNARRILKQKVRESLARSGANEVLTYSFVHENTFKKAEQDSMQAFQVGNALSPDLQYYRLSVLPSLLEKVHGNIKAGHDEFVLFEIGKGHNKKYHANDDEGLPSEMDFVDAVYTSKKPHNGAAYYYMRTLVTQLAKDLGFTLTFKPINDPLDFPVTAPFELQRSALLETQDGIFIGMIGELKQSVLRNFKLPQYTSAMTLDTEGLQKAYETPRQTYSPLSRFPSISQDISLVVASDVDYAGLFARALEASQKAAGSDVDIQLTLRDIYQQESSNEKTITLRLTATNHQKTLNDKIVATYIDAIAAAAAKDYGAKRG